MTGGSRVPRGRSLLGLTGTKQIGAAALSAHIRTSAYHRQHPSTTTRLHLILAAKLCNEWGRPLIQTHTCWLETIFAYLPISKMAGANSCDSFASWANCIFVSHATSTPKCNTCQGGDFSPELERSIAPGGVRAVLFSVRATPSLRKAPPGTRLRRRRRLAEAPGSNPGTANSPAACEGCGQDRETRHPGDDPAGGSGPASAGALQTAPVTPAATRASPNTSAGVR